MKRCEMKNIEKVNFLWKYKNINGMGCCICLLGLLIKSKCWKRRKKKFFVEVEFFFVLFMINDDLYNRLGVMEKIKKRVKW